MDRMDKEYWLEKWQIFIRAFTHWKEVFDNSSSINTLIDEGYLTKLKRDINNFIDLLDERLSSKNLPCVNFPECQNLDSAYYHSKDMVDNINQLSSKPTIHDFNNVYRDLKALIRKTHALYNVDKRMTLEQWSKST